MHCTARVVALAMAALCAFMVPQAYATFTITQTQKYVLGNATAFALKQQDAVCSFRAGLVARACCVRGSRVVACALAVPRGTVGGVGGCV